MLDREQAKKRRDARCRHFTGIQNETCDAKVKYPHISVLPCYGEHGECSGYSPLTVEELAAKEAEQQRHIDLMRQGLSSCCEAPFDTSQVITSGRFKNHGPRFCSKCKRVCFMV
jgi:hypothetical protein